MRIHPEFPDNHRRDPRRQAELHVYEALEASDTPGIALYGARLTRNCREIDFLLLLIDVARIAVEVKGGNYRLDGTEWQLQTPTGWERVSNPLTQAWESSMQLRDALGERLEHKPFILPVVLFPDMDRDAAIEARAVRARVHAIFGMDRLVETLAEIGREGDVFYPPAAQEAEEEAELIMPGAGQVKPRAALDLHVRQLVIQHADVVNVYNMPHPDGR